MLILLDNFGNLQKLYDYADHSGKLKLIYTKYNTYMW